MIIAGRMRGLVALAFGIAAVPVLATEGMTCAAAGKDAPFVGLAIGHAAEPGVANAYFSDGRQEIKVAVSQSWLDDDKVWVNLGDPDLMALMVKLRASGPPDNLRGTLTYKGKTYKVRCTGDE